MNLKPGFLNNLLSIRLLFLAVACALVAFALLNGTVVMRAQQSSGAKAIVRHGFTISGRIEGSVQQLSAETTALNGGGEITGDLLVPGTPTVRLNGHPTFGGVVPGTGSAQPTNYQITLNGNARLGHLVTRSDPTTMPSVAAPPSSTGTRDVTLTNSSQSPGNFATLRDLTLNGNVGLIAVPPGTYRKFTANGGSGFVLGVAGSTEPAVYNFNSLLLNGGSQLQIVGPVVLTSATAMTLNGSTGSPSHPSWLMLRVAVGGITLNGGSALYGQATAPSGTVTINGNSSLIGNVISDRLTINGNGLLRVQEEPQGDVTSPVLTIQQPADGALTNATQVTVTGTYSDESQTTITVNGVTATLSGNSFTANVTLVEGPNSLLITATDASNNQSTATRNVIRDTESPIVSLVTPQEGAILNGVPVFGTVTDATAVSITVNGATVPIADGMFDLLLVLADGNHAIQVTATDAAGNTSQVTRNVITDSTAPVITEIVPTPGTIIPSGSMSVQGKVSDSTTVAVTVNGVAANVDPDGRFSLAGVPVSQGNNQFTITAIDAASNSRSTSGQVIGKDITPPLAVEVFPVISPTTMTTQTLEGRTESSGRIRITGGVEPITTEAAPGSGLFLANVKLAQGNNVLTVTSTDEEGNTSPPVLVTITSDPNIQPPAVGEPSRINVATGNMQRGLVAIELPRSLIAIVTDVAGDPVPNAQVDFSMLEGGGHFIGGSNTLAATTDDHGYARARYVAGANAGIQLMRATFTGNRLTPAVFSAEARASSPGDATSVSGTVLDQNLRALPNALIRIGGQQTRTDIDGRFFIESVSSGPHQLLEIIGRDQIALSGRWPNITYDMDVLPGINNNLGRPLFLPKVNDGISMPLDSNNIVTQDTVFELPVVGGQPPVRVVARAGTHVSFPPDVTDKRLSVTRIATDRVPMALEDGRATNLYISVQPSGALFDQPLEISFPNLDHQPANSEVLLMSFDHDAGRYVRVGTGHVSADGTSVKSDPGSGIRVGAWHALPPPKPQPEVTILGHIQIAENPTFAQKKIVEATAWAEGERANLVNGMADLDNAPQWLYRVTYAMIPDNPLGQIKATAIADKIDVVIYNGQAGAAVDEKNEEKIGAFTVANLNDTDGNGTPDKDDTEVKAGAKGRDEVDLMKLEILKPTAPTQPGATPPKVTMKVVSGTVKFWTESTKKTAVTDMEFLVSDLPKTLWVEATAASTSVRDIVIEMSYKGTKDTVKATAVWAEKTNFRNTAGGLSADADGATIKATFANFYSSTLGLVDNAKGIRNEMEMEFTVTPANIGREPGVVFDITRQKESFGYAIMIQNGQPTLVSVRFAGNTVPSSFPAQDETPNDDNFNDDEDDIPKNNHIYSLDGPGEGTPGTAYGERSSVRLNFYEFTRVRFDSQAFANSDLTVEGSRCSDKVSWTSRTTVIKNAAGGWVRDTTTATENQIELGHRDIRLPRLQP